MRIRRRLAAVGALLGALGAPAVLVLVELVHVADPVALVGLITTSAAINSVWPLGGGMLAQGTYRTRFLRLEWTHDIDRSPPEAFLAGFGMGLVTAGSFVIYLPLLAELWLRAAPFSATVLTWVALGALLFVTWLRHRREHAIYAWCERVDAGEAIGEGELARWVRALGTLALSSGAIGHTGGIGAFTVGLHEHLDAERVLRSAAEHQVAGASELHARALDYLAACALSDGGFPAYPRGDARLEFTARAVVALGPRLDDAARAKHAAFAARCRRGPAAFARSARGEAYEDELRWGQALSAKDG